MTLLILLRALAIYCCYNCNESLNFFANLGTLKLQMLAENWVIRNDFVIGHGFRAVISHRCAISKKRCEKKCGRTGIYAEKYGKGKNWKEVPLAIALHWSPATGSGSGKGLSWSHYAQNVGPCLLEVFSPLWNLKLASASLLATKNLQSELLIGGRGRGGEN